MAGLDELGGWLSKEVETLSVDLSQEVSNACAKYIERVTIETPVDTSLASSNWRVMIGGDGGDIIPPHYTGSRGSTAGASKGRAIALADAILASRKFGQSAFLFNRVDYIDELNRGTSKQAPSGFIDSKIAQLENDLDNIVRGQNG